VDYLDQLKKSCKAPDDEPKKTKELPKPNCLGFLGSSSGVFEKIQALDSSPRWLVHFADRNPLQVAFSPSASHAEVLAGYPDALAAEPITHDLDEHDLGAGNPDDRRRCTQCGNLRSGVCSVAKPGGQAVSALRGYRPALDLLQRCRGFSALSAQRG